MRIVGALLPRRKAGLHVGWALMSEALDSKQIWKLYVQKNRLFLPLSYT
jgi:hypothetical protein